MRNSTAPLCRTGYSKAASMEWGGSWKYLSQGTYNYALVDPLKKWVLKLPKRKKTCDLDDPKRASRVFNEINYSMRKQATDIGNYWLSPYIEGKAINPREQEEYIFNLYATKNRLLLDGYCANNILKEASTGRLVCIDPGNIIRFDSVASELNWLSSCKDAVKRRTVFRKDWIHKIKILSKKKNYLYARPIFMTIGLDFFCRKVAINVENTERVKHYLRRDNVFALGVFLYFYHYLQYYKKFSLTLNIANEIIKEILKCEEPKFLQMPWHFYLKHGKNAAHEYIQSQLACNLYNYNAAQNERRSSPFFADSRVDDSNVVDNYMSKPKNK